MVHYLGWEDCIQIWRDNYFGNDHCIICGDLLEKNKFPDDYPDDWKFCCGCKVIAGFIVDGIIKKEHTEANYYDRILNKITLVK